MIRRQLLLALVAACAPLLVGIGAAASNRFECLPATDLVKLSRPLARVSSRILRNEEVTILALGSSSTFGTGASRPDNSYPSRLQLELRALLPKSKVKVINRGVGGEDARQMLPRLANDLAAEKPDLVLWQVGTNALLSDRGIDMLAPLIHDGLGKIRAAGADAVLIDPQYAPYVLRDPDARPTVTLLARIADEAGVSVFRRFALMQYWHEARDFAFSDILAPDLFHMNDWSYGCLARNLAAALVAGVSAGQVNAPAAATTSTATAAPFTPAAATIPVASAAPEPSPPPVTAVSAVR